MTSRMRAYLALLLAAMAAACARAPAHPATPEPPGAPTTGAATGLPPVPLVTAPLSIDVVYPREGSAINVRDSTFIFGNVGTGESLLRINGQQVTVEPNGAFIAF